MNMLQLAREQAGRLILRAWTAAVSDDAVTGPIPLLPAAEPSADPVRGDLSSPFCLAAAGPAGLPAPTLARMLVRYMDCRDTCFTQVEAAGPGYLNFRLSDAWYAHALRAMSETAMRRASASAADAAPLPVLREAEWADALRRRFLGQALANILDRTGDAFVCIPDEDHYVNREAAGSGTSRILQGGTPVTTPPAVDTLPSDALRFLLCVRLDRDVSVDLDLARRQDAANPYYRVRYVRDRIVRLLERCARVGRCVPDPAQTDLPAPHGDGERALIRLLCRWDDVVSRAARTADPGLLSEWLTNLADSWWDLRRALLPADPASADSTPLLLSHAVRLVLEDGLSLLGIAL